MDNDQNLKKDPFDMEKFRHDLKNPLAVMRMKLDLFEMSDEYKKGDPQTLDLVKTLNEQIDALVKQINA